MRISDWSSDVCSSDLYKDLQLGQVLTTATVVTNAARAQVDGVELEWRLAIDGHFSLDGFIANNRARFSSYSSRNPGITGSQTLDLRGNLLPNAPKWTRSEEHTSELQSLMRISYTVFCLKNKT